MKFAGNPYKRTSKYYENVGVLIFVVVVVARENKSAVQMCEEIMSEEDRGFTTK